MPLEAPPLHTPVFEDILRDLRLRIPRYAPEWTDFNDSDPGMTLAQLFAWLTEMMLVEMNRVPDRNYIKFLQLLGMELRPAQPATAHLTFSADAKALVVGPVPPRARISAQPPGGGQPLIFETEAGLDLIRVPLTDVQVYDGTAFAVVTPANATPGTPFRPLGWIPQVGSALYLGFAQLDPSVPGGTRAFPQELHFRVFLPPTAQVGQAQSVAEAENPPAPPVTLVWEYRPLTDPPRPATDPAPWRRLSLYSDESAAFTREGYILLEGPRQIAPTVEGKLTDDARFWLRARLAEGSYPAGREPEIDFLRPNMVEARNLSTVNEELVGTSEGTPRQLFRLRRTPVQPATLVLETEVIGVAERWQQVDDFLASGRNDPHFVLNANSGEIRLGDGEHGRIPAAGADIIARTYRYGGGKAGNVGEGLISTMVTSLSGVDKVTNERPAVGGRDEQSVEELKEQAPHELRSRGRAVTAEDYTALAEQAGGVAKARALPLMHPDHPGVEVPGAVTVVIVPDTDDVPPRPSSDQIEAVCRYLNRFRLLTTEVYVKGPVYQAISIEARVSAQPYAAFDTVAQEVTKAINAFLAPLSRGSTDTTGWPFGQDLHPTNLYGVIRDVQTVAVVESLTVLVDGRPHDDIKTRVRVPPDGLLYGANHLINVVPATDS